MGVVGTAEPLSYGGLAGAKLIGDDFDLGYGVALKATYANLTAPHLLMLNPPRSIG